MVHNDAWKILNKKLANSPQDVLSILIENRDISKKDVENFLHPVNPLTFTAKDVGIDSKEMKKAVKRINLAKQNKEKVIIFGDYDADGINATAILWETLYAYGVDVVPFIPHREKHGYGLSNKALDDILVHPVDLIITVDNGIVAHDPFKRLKKLGISTILTDHHVKEKEYPEADCIIHTTQLCGATVAWMLAKEIDKKSAEKSLDLAAIATIADQVPLISFNRSFAYIGLDALRKTTRPGILELLKIANIDKEKIDSYTINFAIAPRLNAMGRLEHAMDALRLVCMKNKDKAQLLAQHTQHINENRQTLTWDSIQLAREQAHLWEKEHIIVVSGNEFHDGVIGLIAGKLSEEFYKPTIVINVSPDASKASARSVPGVNLIELIRKAKHLLLELGGHPMAAGFAIETNNIEMFTQTIQEIARKEIDVSLLKKSTAVECVLPASLVNLETEQEISILEPYGVGNAKPMFCIKDLEITEIVPMGYDKKHTKITLQHDDITISGIYFGMTIDKLKYDKGQHIDVIGYLSRNTWKQVTQIQFIIKDISA